MKKHVQIRVDYIHNPYRRFSSFSPKDETSKKGVLKKMNEKNYAVVMKLFPEKWKQVEDFLDSIGATVIFVKQADANRKLVVKNLPNWEGEKSGENSNSITL